MHEPSSFISKFAFSIICIFTHCDLIKRRGRVHNMTGNCLFGTFILKYINIYTYFVKKRDSYQIFRLRMKILWEPGFPSLSHPDNTQHLIFCPPPGVTSAGKHQKKSESGVSLLEYFRSYCSRCRFLRFCWGISRQIV